MTNWKTTVMTKLCLLSILALVLPLYEAMALNSGKDGLLTLVKDGVPAATIIIDKNPTKAAAFAVEELNYHINKITGIKLPVKSTDIANAESAARLRSNIGKNAFNSRCITAPLGINNELKLAQSNTQHTTKGLSGAPQQLITYSKGTQVFGTHRKLTHSTYRDFKCPRHRYRR